MTGSWTVNVADVQDSESDAPVRCWHLRNIMREREVFPFVGTAAIVREYSDGVSTGAAALDLVSTFGDTAEVGDAWVIVQTTVCFDEPEREAEFNRWYAGTHVPEVFESPGFVRNWRLRMRSGAESGGVTYWSVYETSSFEDYENLISMRIASGAEPYDGIWLPYISDYRDSYHEVAGRA